MRIRTTTGRGASPLSGPDENSRALRSAATFLMIGGGR
jgi:hypothetical protein